MVRYITELDEWNTLMETSNSKLVVVDFTASWYVPSFVLVRRWIMSPMKAYINAIDMNLTPIISNCVTGAVLVVILVPSLRNWRKKTPRWNSSRSTATTRKRLRRSVRFGPFRPFTSTVVAKRLTKCWEPIRTSSCP